MKNKLFKILTALFVVCVMAFTLSACSNDGNKGNNDGDDKPDEIVYVTEGVVYEISDDQTYAIVKDYTGDAKYVEILSTYENLPVRVIGEEAFYYAFEMVKIKIPDSVTEIGAKAFGSCEKLIEVKIPSDVEIIDFDTFSGCIMLSSVTIPDTVTEIKARAFNTCRSLTELIIPKSVATMGYDVFSSCYALTLRCKAESMPEGWSGDFEVYYGFEPVPVVWDCDNNTIAIDNNEYAVINGVRYALKGENATVALQPYTIINANIPQMVNYGGKTYSVNKMVKNAFYCCGLLQSATVPSSITDIPERAFYYCTALSSLTIESGVQVIWDNAIQECSSLAEVVIPESVIAILSNAFNSNPALTIYCEVAEKPDGWYNDWVYENDCKKVWNCKTNEVAEDGNIYKIIDSVRYALKDGVATVVRQPANLVDIVIPASVEYKGQTYAVTTIESYAFYQIESLKKVNILDGVETIQQYAFYSCSFMTELVIPTSVTTIGRCAITSDHYNLWVYCQSGSKLAGWDNSWSLISAVCYYSETEPTTSGLFWRYVDGVITRWGAE